MELRYHPEVEIEVRESARFYEERREELGQASLQAVQAGIVRIRASPLTWPKVGRRVRRIILDRFPYHIIYAVVGERVIIVAVAHDRRRPGYWRKRLKEL